MWPQKWYASASPGRITAPTMPAPAAVAATPPARLRNARREVTPTPFPTASLECPGAAPGDAVKRLGGRRYARAERATPAGEERQPKAVASGARERAAVGGAGPARRVAARALEPRRKRTRLADRRPLAVDLERAARRAATPDGEHDDRRRDRGGQD